ncbi:MAG: hypothetical protein LE178_03300, partial [Endomicrobium sp.]|nr:hypothetical protein [Endomicrobium sp.]
VETIAATVVKFENEPEALTKLKEKKKDEAVWVEVEVKRMTMIQVKRWNTVLANIQILKVDLEKKGTFETWTEEELAIAVAEMTEGEAGLVTKKARLLEMEALFTKLPKSMEQTVANTMCKIMVALATRIKKELLLEHWVTEEKWTDLNNVALLSMMSCTAPGIFNTLMRKVVNLQEEMKKVAGV